MKKSIEQVQIVGFVKDGARLNSNLR